MRGLKQDIQADLFKLRKTAFFWLHLVVPFLGIIIFFGYQKLTNYPANALTINYFQLLALIYPILAVWMTTILVDQEIEAGGGFFLLNASSKARVLFSKIILLLTPGLFSCLFIGLGYHLVLSQFKSDYSLPLSLIFILTIVIWGSALFLYFFHLWLGFCFGRNVNFALAAVEFLLSALLLTGLGETIWFFFPCAWGIRLVPLVATYFSGNTLEALQKIEMGLGSIISLTGIMLIFLFVWFSKWEGRGNEA